MFQLDCLLCRAWRSRLSKWCWCPRSLVSFLPQVSMIISEAQVLGLTHVHAGVLVNEFFPGFVKKIKPILPLVGVAITTLLCASPCAQVAPILR